MSKPRRTKQPEFLRFRPYHAFTAHAERPARIISAGKLLALAVVGVVALISFTLWISHH